jgi:hypothetical protein
LLIRTSSRSCSALRRSARANLGQRVEVGAVVGEPTVPRLGPDPGQEALAAFLAAAVQQQRRPASGQRFSDRCTEAVGGAGDQDRLLLDRPHALPASRILDGPWV